MNLLDYLIEEPESETVIAPAEERNSFEGISNPETQARERAEAKKRYYYAHRTEIKAKSKRTKSQNEKNEEA